MSDQIGAELERILEIAWAEARAAGAEALEPVHLLIAAAKDEGGPATHALEKCGIDFVKLRRRVRGFARQFGAKAEGGPTRVSSRATVVIRAATEAAAATGREANSADLLAAVLQKPDASMSAVIEGEGLAVDKIIAACAEARPAEVPRGGAQPKRGGTFLDKFGKDYTALARDGKLDPMIGRRDELKQIVRVLLRKQKNNPVLVGDPGVGKTSLVEGLAQYAASGDAPAEVREWRIVELPIASIVAGAKYRGDIEERLQSIIKQAEEDARIVLFLDEIHTLIGAGGAGDALDAANILKPALARGSIRCIGATTPAEYARYIEKDPALERRFQPVRIDEPSPDETRAVLRGLKALYETHHGVEIAGEAIDAAVDLSIRYVPDRRLPDKARDLIDQAAANKRMFTLSPGRRGSEKPRVTKSDVAEVVADWTGIAAARLTSSEQERLSTLENALRQRVVGQDAAVNAVSRVVRTAFAGLSRPNRPYGVFLFIGPSGVGKTELAKALAEFLFDDEARLLRFDMSEYMEEHSVACLIGSPPGYVGHDEGGALTNAIRRTPYSVVLFDEIEKAHPRVADLFLQVFDDGRLTDAHGRIADFRNTIVIMTSNYAKPAVEAAAHVGFIGGKDAAPAAAPSRLPGFRTELLNRIDEVIEFNALDRSHIHGIIDKLVHGLEAQLKGKVEAIRLTQRAREALADEGYDPKFGARAMQRVFDRNVVQPLAQGLLEGKFKPGDVVQADASGGRIVLTANVVSGDHELVAGTVLHSTMVKEQQQVVAMLLVDMIKSTHLVQQGDTDYVRRVQELRDVISGHARAQAMRFLKCTGDGFLAVFDDLPSALEVARTVRRSELTDLRVVLHHGRVKAGPDGDPLGVEVHRLFRVEALEAARSGAHILLTHAAADALSATEKPHFRRLGTFALEGFAQLEEVWVEGTA